MEPKILLKVRAPLGGRPDSLSEFDVDRIGSLAGLLLLDLIDQVLKLGNAGGLGGGSALDGGGA